MSVIGITGAGGFLGRALSRRLAGAGHTVVPVPRAPGLLPRFDALVHLAGENVAGLWTRGKRRRILESRTGGTRRLVSRMREAPPGVFLCASAAGYYGHRPGEVLDENAPPGRGFRPGVCVAWEREARAAEALGVRTVLLRFGTVLDPSGGYLGRMLPFLRRGLCFVLGRPRDRFSWVSLEDAVRFVAFALERPSLRGPVNVTAPRALTQGEFARTVARWLGRRVLGRLPRSALRLALGELASAFVDWQDVRPVRARAEGFRFSRTLLSEALP